MQLAVQGVDASQMRVDDVAARTLSGTQELGLLGESEFSEHRSSLLRVHRGRARLWCGHSLPRRIGVDRSDGSGRKIGAWN